MSRMRHGPRFGSGGIQGFRTVAGAAKWLRSATTVEVTSAKEQEVRKARRERWKRENSSILRWADEHPEEVRRDMLMRVNRATQAARRGKMKITLPKVKFGIDEAAE